MRQMSVIAVDDVLKQFTVIFGGGHSGQYQISVRHREYGLVGTEFLILDVRASVIEFSPRTGSVFGGTLLTITGNNFGNVYTDNTVQISNNEGTDSIDCLVQETSQNQIKCRLDVGFEKGDSDEDTLVVSFKNSEEATCEPEENCVFTWTRDVPLITNA